MKVYKINPSKLTITELDAPYNEESGCIDNKFITEQIGCNYFDVVRLENGDCIFVDDEGMLREGVQPSFLLGGYEQPLIGNGLVIGSSMDGSSQSPVISKKSLTGRIKFCAVIFEVNEETNTNN
tara:strand:- start:234 stop:605 length:372 start_codon:yes stop_codon:yes gene_type:complete